MSARIAGALADCCPATATMAFSRIAMRLSVKIDWSCLERAFAIIISTASSETGTNPNILTEFATASQEMVPEDASVLATKDCQRPMTCWEMGRTPLLETERRRAWLCTMVAASRWLSSLFIRLTISSIPGVSFGGGPYPQTEDLKNPPGRHTKFEKFFLQEGLTGFNTDPHLAKMIRQSGHGR
jgi:hypothetical protein